MYALEISFSAEVSFERTFAGLATLAARPISFSSQSRLRGESPPDRAGYTRWTPGQTPPSLEMGVPIWCALHVELPDEHGGRLRTPRLRKASLTRLTPLCVLHPREEDWTVRFPANGAPFILPNGAPDVWRAASDQARQMLTQCLDHGSQALLAVRWTGPAHPAGVIPELKIHHKAVAPVATDRLLGRYGAAAGTCLSCRHANQETLALREGDLRCRMVGTRRAVDSCEVSDFRNGKKLFAYEPWDGTNTTWGHPLPVELH